MSLRIVLSLLACLGVVGCKPAAESGNAHDAHGAESGHDHDHGHDHGHGGHAHENCVELSAQARNGIGLSEGPVKLSTFRRTIGVPGMVVERRGRSQLAVIAPMTGYVTQILVTEGEAVAVDQPLFEVRLTHEDLVQSQADLLRTAEELDVVRREITRLQGIGPEGVVAGRTIIDRRYEQQKAEAVLRAQSQALLLHGLSAAQVDDILKTRTLLSTVMVRVPRQQSSALTIDSKAVLQIQELRIERGQNVEAGETLAVLADHASLLIEGEAFEQDAPQISEAVAKKFTVTALLEGKTTADNRLTQLPIEYVANRVDPASRTLHFYVDLPNTLVRDADAGDGRRFVEWRYKPGQRMQLRVPVEEWPDRIVLPTEAVAQDGVENYIFQSNGDHFDRRPVKVDYRDPQWVVIANDGALFPGDKIAMSAAQQLQLALKSKSGGAIDPHAGHNH